MRAREFFINESNLFEIDMSPSSLKKLAKGINARAGMEFEMIVPNVGSTDDDYDLEPDYDQDERIHGIGDIRNFFDDRDYNSSRDVDRLEESIIDDYLSSDWLNERKQQAWEESSYNAIKELVERDYDDELYEQARAEIEKQTPEFGVNADEFKAEVEARYEKLKEEKINEILSEGGQDYNNAYEEWDDTDWSNIWSDDDLIVEWLNSEGIQSMAELASNYTITWPHYIENSRGDEVKMDEVAHEFSKWIGRQVNYSSNYHGAKRTLDSYSLEPDSSLRPDDSNDAGLEFISPPMPIDELIDDLKNVKEFADDLGCYTNDSTGLHINVSVPSLQNSAEKLDYVKLALLLGDKYVLEQFGRQGNSYAKSALDIVKERVRQRPEDASALLQQMKSHLNNLASKLIHSGITNKYTSINNKQGYIEFRSPGGDWLGENFDKITNTLLRFVVALDAATDPEKYRQEYLKKLYSILQLGEKENTMTYFAQFAAGKLPKQALKSFIRQAQLERKIQKNPAGGQKYWWRVSNPTYSHGEMEVVATTKEEAIEKALAPDGYPSWANTRQTIQAIPIRPYDDSPLRARVGEPEPIGWQDTGVAGSQTDMENRLGWGGQTADANYEIVDRRTNRPVFLFIANTDTEAWRKYSDWLAASGYPEDTEDFGWRRRGDRGQHARSGTEQNQQGEFTGYWRVLINGREVHRFGGVGNNQGDANRVGRDWILQQVRSGQMQQPTEGAEIEVVPVMR